MIDLVRRHVYRVLRNFTALVIFFMTADFLAGPIYYLVSVHQYGFYWLAGWQIKMIFTSPITNFLEYVMLAFMVQILWEIPRFIIMTIKNTYRLILNQNA